MNSNWKRLLHLFSLTNIAISLPLFQKIADYPEFFVAHGASSLDLIATVILLSFLLPVFLFSLEWAVGLFREKSGRGVHAALLCILMILLILPLLKQILPTSGYMVMAISSILAIVLVAFYQHSSAFFQTFTLLSPLAIAVPFLFLFQAPIRSILTQSNKAVLHKTSAKIPVILVVFDEMPLTSLLDENGNIDDTRYPNFAELARQSNWYRNATTCSSLTDIAVPAILTGNFPEQTRLPVLSEYPNNLFTLLGGSYDLHVKEAITMLDPKRFQDQGRWDRVWLILKDMSAVYLQWIAPGHFTDLLPSVTETWGNFWDDEREANRAGDFRSFVNEISDHASESSLHFLHMMLPHKPWVYLPSGKEYRDYGSLAWGTLQNNRGIWQNDPEVVSQFQRRHLLQVGFLDRLLGEMIQKLKTSGLYESSLLIVTSDHGVGFWPGESLRKPSSITLQDILYVPFFVKLPGQSEGVVRDDVVETVDILPTIADVLKIELPWKVVGQSVLDSSRPGRKQRTRIKPTNELVKFKSNFSIDSVTFQYRLKELGARSSFDTFFGVPALTIPPLDPRLKQMKALVLDGDAYEKVDLKSNFIPAYVSGIIRAPKDSDRFTLQILVNGMTRAVTMTFPERKGRIRFGALVPESSFQQGKNRIEVVILQ